MMVDEAIRRAILQRLPAVEIDAMARARGIGSMYQDGAVKVWQGLTTVEEILRVTNEF
jgi:general secretion pathway protein E